MVNDVIQGQLDMGVIEKIPDLTSFMIENLTCSFLAHMPIFKLERSSTKCRVVYMSNLAGIDKIPPFIV